MNPPPRSEGSGTLLVALQFALLAALAWLAAPAFLDAVAPAGAWMLVAAGVALGVAALLANPPGNFNIRPAPRAGGRLVQRGAYRWLRHPMYSALLLAGAGAAWAAGGAAGWAVLLALALLLAVKAAVEERGLRALYPEYAAYCGRSWRFVPGLY